LKFFLQGLIKRKTAIFSSGGRLLFNLTARAFILSRYPALDGQVPMNLMRIIPIFDTLTPAGSSVILLSIFELIQQSLLLQVLSPARFPQQYSDF